MPSVNKIPLSLVLVSLLSAGIGTHVVSAQVGSFPSLKMSIAILDWSGQSVREATNGQQVIVSETVTNDAYPEDRPLVVMLEIRDERDVTVYIAYQSATVSPDETYQLGISWTIPDQASQGDTYALRSYSITSLGRDSQPLSGGVVREIVIS